MNNEELNILSRLYKRLEKTKIPSFTGDDKLDEWIENLIEIDAIIAGLACSFLGGEKITPKQIPDISSLREVFNSMNKKYNANLEEIEQCRNYLELLLTLHKELMQLVKR